MAHLSDKPLGLKKMQREIKALQDHLNQVSTDLLYKIEENDRLQAEVRRLNAILSKKGTHGDR